MQGLRVLALGGSSLVGGNDMTEARDLRHFVPKTVVASCPCVGLIPPHDSRPLGVAHGGGAAVGKRVNDHVFRLDEK